MDGALGAVACSAAMMVSRQAFAYDDAAIMRANSLRDARTRHTPRWRHVGACWGGEHLMGHATYSICPSGMTVAFAIAEWLPLIRRVNELSPTSAPGSRVATWTPPWTTAHWPFVSNMS